jgi:hypothetical protein
MARTTMFAWSTIISTGCRFSAPAQLLEVGHSLLFIDVRERRGKTVGRSFNLWKSGLSWGASGVWGRRRQAFRRAE